MDGYSCIAILTLFTVALSLWKYRKRKDYQYSLLDTAGMILNTVLMVMVYPPLCLLCILMTTGTYVDKFPMVLEGVTAAMARLMPAVCVAGIGASVVLRRKERPVLSFALQFAGTLWFCLLLLVAKF